MTPTLCSELWRSITLDNRGNAYSCCLIKPVSMGNIYSSKLRDIVNSSSIVQERVKSMAGELSCFSTCNWPNKGSVTADNAGELGSGEVAYDKLESLHLNFGERCNISCIMCKQRARYSQNPWILDPEVLTKNVDVTPFKEIIVQGGEPLVIPECRRYLDYLGSMGKKYTLLTNGLLIDDEMADKLSKDAKIVCISLNAASQKVHEFVNRGSSWQKVMENIRRLANARSRNGTALEIWGRMTITTHAIHEIPQFLREWQSFGFDHVNFGYDRETVPTYLACNSKFADDLRKETQNSLAGLDLTRVDLLRLKQLGIVGEVA